MKKVLIPFFFLLLLSSVYGQTIPLKQVELEDAIGKKSPLQKRQADFSAAGAGIIINAKEDATAAQLKDLAGKLFLIVDGVPDQTYKFVVQTVLEKDAWVIDFKKNKLASVKQGDAVVLKLNDKSGTELLRIINSKEAIKGDGNSDKPLVNSIYPGYFDKLQEKLTINIYNKFKIPFDFCCDTCKSCEDTILSFNNRIVYDAIAGLTYFIPYKFDQGQLRDSGLFLKLCDTCRALRIPRERFLVNNKRRIHLKAGDPLAYIVRNVNPYLYDVELTDTAFLVSNETTGLLESLLFSKIDNPQGISPQSVNPEATTSAEEERYLLVKTALIHLRAEMGLLLENYRVMSRVAHNCIEERKANALEEIDNFLNRIGKSNNQSFASFTDIFLDPTSTDSSLGKNVKALYGEFLRSKYVIAYRFPDIPESDQILFKLSIKRKENSPYPNLLTSNYPTQVGYVKNFFKIDVSSGPYLGGLSDNEYTTRGDSNVSVTPIVKGNRIIKENTGKLEFGFASYLHFYYKFGYFFNAGLHIGAGINFSDKPRPRYFTGASFLLGNNNRLCVNTGLMWGKVTELSDQYSRGNNGEYKWLPEGESSLATRNRLKSSWFISITYNLPFIKRNKSTTTVEPPATDTSKSSGATTATTNTSAGSSKNDTSKAESSKKTE